MDASASAGRRRTPSALLVLTVIALMAAAVVAAPAQAAIPANYFTVSDSGGANDVNSAQVDLTQFGRDDADTSVYKFFWSWDATDQWTGGGQTGDACALFDSNVDTFIDFAVCGQVQNPGMDTSIVMQTPASPLVFTCNDSKNDRCAGPAPQVFGAGDLVAGALDAAAPIPSPPTSLITDTDPFLHLLPDQNWPDDTTIEMIVDKSFLPPGAVLVNVCSYPSIGNGANNNPFDCIVTPGGGFIVIHKVAPGATNQQFAFTVQPGDIAQTITGSGETAPISIEVGQDRSVSESLPAGWTLGSAQCTLADGSPTGTLLHTTIAGVSVHSGAVTDCTFTNVGPPALGVDKTADAGTVSAGTPIGFQIVVTNRGIGPAQSVQITDSLPTDGGLSWSIESSSANATCTIAAGLLTCGVGTLAPGQSATVHITSPTTFATCGTVENTARAMGSNGSAAPHGASVIVQCPDLRFTKVADDATVAAGDAIGFVLTATNDGPGVATSTTLTDTLPAAGGLAWSIVAGDSTAGCSIAGSVLTCDWGTLDAHESATVHVTSPTTRGSCGKLDNNATLTASNGGAPEGASASVVVDCGLTVIKHVVNDDGGSATAADWSLHVRSGGAEVALSPQPGSETGSTYHLAAGAYDVSETGGPSGYAASFGGACDGQGHVNRTPGAGSTCTITNDDVAPRLTVIKHVVNLGGSTATAAAFQMDVSGQDVSDAHFPGAEGGTTVTLDAGAYAVDESGGPATFFKERSADCSGQIAIGQHKTCTITNTKLLPAGVVVKIGPDHAYHGDTLNYTFDVSGPGATPLTNVTVTDDRCAPVTGPTQKIGGDQDALLEPGEHWIYTCSTPVPVHTTGDTSVVNTVTLAGTDADGAPVSDTDSHTTRILHPAIDIEKGGPASAQAGQPVNYGLLVTNTGDVPFLATNVSVTDALCDAPPFLTTVNGDTTPGQLDPGDRWGYICRVFTAAGQTLVDNVGVVAAIDVFGGRRVVDVDRAATVLTQPPAPLRPSDVAPIAGTARLIGTSRCIRNAFRVQVRGTQIAQVSFYVDGKLRARIAGRAGRTVFTTRIAAPRRTDTRVHRLTARVRFDAASETRARTLRLAYQRCASAAARPAFTG